MFKNAMLYRMAPGWQATLAEVEDKLGAGRFHECGATQAQAMGWVAPRGQGAAAAHGPLVESVAGQWLLKLMVETKVVPGAVVKRKTDAIAQKIERDTGRKPGRKQTKELKEAALLELLPQAFTKQATVGVWIAPKQRLLLVDAGSQARADEVVSTLVKALAGLSVTLIQTETTAATAMAEWLATREPPAGFTVDRECELQSSDDMKSVVRYARHGLDTDEVREHIASGKRPTRLALTWEGRVSFVLTEAMQIKKLSFLDVVFEGSKEDKDDGFDADAAITTGELGKLIPDLLAALGGEAQARVAAPQLLAA